MEETRIGVEAGRGKGGILRPWVVALLAGAAIFPIWFDLGNHPLSPRSEGRYASAAYAMVKGEGWLIPRLEGHPHLTKPPLTYWCEAACMKVAGVNEWAARFPSALAGSLTLLIGLGLGWKVGGRRVGVLTLGLLAVMPLQLVISRLTITDAMLNLFWTGALAAGYLAVKEPARRRWAVLMWVSVGLGLMTKGPLAWVPVGCILAWLALGVRVDRARVARRGWRGASAWMSAFWKAMKLKAAPLGLGWGMAISAIPLALWVAAARWFDPTAFQTWWHEMVNRIGGESDLHREPVWYFIPVFLGGLFPATAMLNLPGINYSWKAAWADLRAGRDACLWALAVLLPFVMYSCISGKLASYLAPLCPPLAILAAVTLEGWITRAAERRAEGVKPPGVAGTLTVCFCGTVLIGPVLVWGPGWLDGLAKSGAMKVLPRKAAAQYAEVIAALGDSVATFRTTMERDGVVMLEAGAVLLAAAALWMGWTWMRRPDRRARTLGAVWAAFVIFWVVLLAVQNGLDNKDSDEAMLVDLHRAIGPSQVTLVTFGFADSTLSFYNRQDAPRVTAAQLEARLKAQPAGLVVVAEERAWRELERTEPAVAQRFERVMGWKLWTKIEPRVVMRAAGGGATRPSS